MKNNLCTIIIVIIVVIFIWFLLTQSSFMRLRPGGTVTKGVGDADVGRRGCCELIRTMNQIEIPNSYLWVTKEECEILREDFLNACDRIRPAQCTSDIKWSPDISKNTCLAKNH